SLPHDERLAPLQAILKCVAGRWIVEAQGGGAVRVGNGRPAQFAWINPGDVIHLTESGPVLVFEPGSAAASPSAPAPIGQPGLPAEAPALSGRLAPEVRPMAGAAVDAPCKPKVGLHGNWTLYIVVGGVAVFLLIGLGILVGGKRGPATGPETGSEPDKVIA